MLCYIVLSPCSCSDPNSCEYLWHQAHCSSDHAVLWSQAAGHCLHCGCGCGHCQCSSECPREAPSAVSTTGMSSAFCHVSGPGSLWSAMGLRCMVSGMYSVVSAYLRWLVADYCNRITLFEAYTAEKFCWQKYWPAQLPLQCGNIQFAHVVILAVGSILLSLTWDKQFVG